MFGLSSQAENALEIKTAHQAPLGMAQTAATLPRRPPSIVRC
jgi:hypothetical protein